LIAEEIKASVSRAQETNYLAAVKQAHSDPPMLDAVHESWLPEVKRGVSPNRRFRNARRVAGHAIKRTLKKLRQSNPVQRN